MSRSGRKTQGESFKLVWCVCDFEATVGFKIKLERGLDIMQGIVLVNDNFLSVWSRFAESVTLRALLLILPLITPNLLAVVAQWI